MLNSKTKYLADEWGEMLWEVKVDQVIRDSRYCVGENLEGRFSLCRGLYSGNFFDFLTFYV